MGLDPFGSRSVGSHSIGSDRASSSQQPPVVTSSRGNLTTLQAPKQPKLPMLEDMPLVSAENNTDVVNVLTKKIFSSPPSDVTDDTTFMLSEGQKEVLKSVKELIMLPSSSVVV